MSFLNWIINDAAAAVSTAVDPVQATTLAGSAAPGSDLSMIGLFFQADWIVKLVIVILVLASLWSWAIIFEKWLMVKTVRARSKAFENEFWASDALDKLNERVKKRVNHPMAVMFTAAMEEWFRSKSAPGFSLQSSASRNFANIRERIMQIMQVASNRELEKLENGISFLAATSSSAPFIGLFGTVIGIMNSFHAIGLSKNTSLAAVAPGIAEALFATAVGLLTAIPAYIAYHKFTRDIGHISGRLDDFAMEFSTILSRQVEG
ncbi:MAG: protein TolQ [Alphaproteobacteria bacterium]|nr:protein TolQ [Alphaproteobacteria bacterium]